jgi:hypothetical protein
VDLSLMTSDPNEQPPLYPFKSEPDELRFYPGQAWFTNTGPIGETCAGCAFLKGHRCRKWMQLTGRPERKAPPIKPWLAACKYWEAKPSTAFATKGD